MKRIKSHAPWALLILCAVIVALLCLSACGNKQILDTTYTFDRAIIRLANGKVIEGKVKSWKDYEDGDQIQVKMEDGKTYLVHSANIDLIQDAN